jgi:uncharacterized phiE125 gp8 family phage protein
MRYFVITPPEEPAVSLEEMKAHLRVEHDDDDDRIEQLVEAAQAGFESPEMGTLGRPVAAQEIEIEADPCDRYPLRLFGPIDIAEGVSVLSRDAAGADVEIDPAAYRIDRADTFSPRLVALSGWSYGHGVRIRCTAGLPDDDGRLGNFKSAIKLHVQTIYDGVEELERYRATIDSLLSPYRVLSV